MKTLLIVFLSLALAAAAFFTRPGKPELMLHVLDSSASAGCWSQSDLSAAEQLVRESKINDHWLWVDVEKDGKVLYTGAFAHWFPRGPQAEKAIPAAADLSKLLQAFNGASK